jgi:hypothetical protein
MVSTGSSLPSHSHSSQPDPSRVNGASLEKMPGDLNGSLLAASVTIMAITSVLVALRFWVRTSMKVVGLDDCKCYAISDM